MLTNMAEEEITFTSSNTGFSFGNAVTQTGLSFGNTIPVTGFDNLKWTNTTKAPEVIDENSQDNQTKEEEGN